jgi:hypothetical protein
MEESLKSAPFLSKSKQNNLISIKRSHAKPRREPDQIGGVLEVFGAFGGVLELWSTFGAPWSILRYLDQH